MTTSKLKFKSKAFEAIHSAKSDLYKIGAISQAKMNEADKLCISEPINQSILGERKNQGKKVLKN